MIPPSCSSLPCFAYSKMCQCVPLKTIIEKFFVFQTDVEKHRLRVEGLGVGEGKEVRIIDFIKFGNNTFSILMNAKKKRMNLDC